MQQLAPVRGWDQVLQGGALSSSGTLIRRSRFQIFFQSIKVFNIVFIWILHDESERGSVSPSFSCCMLTTCVSRGALNLGTTWRKRRSVLTARPRVPLFRGVTAIGSTWCCIQVLGLRWGHSSESSHTQAFQLGKNPEPRLSTSALFCL